MDKAIIGKKLGMSQIFTADGKVIPVTVVEAGPCTVVQIKTKENDGYEAVQVGFGAIKETRVNKPVAGHFKKAGVTVKRYLRELRLANCAAYELGQELTCDVFAEGDKVDVTGTSKGHGPHVSRYRPHPPFGGFHGRVLLSLQSVQEQAHGGAVGTREGDGAEPHRRARRQGEKSAAHQGRGSRTEGRRCRRQGFREGLSGGRR